MRCLPSLFAIMCFVCSSPSFSQADTKPPLKVKTYSCTKQETRSGIIVTYEGEVLNQSDRPLEHLVAMVLLRSADREFVSTEEVDFPISPLLPGQTSPFRGLAMRVNPVATLCEIRFRLWPRTALTHESPWSMVPIQAR